MAAQSLRLSTFLFAGGLFTWAIHFTVLYGFNALACGRRFSEVSLAGVSIVVIATLAITFLAVLLLACIVIIAFAKMNSPAYRAPTIAFLRYVSIGGAGLSFVAIVFSATAGLMLPACL